MKNSKNLEKQIGYTFRDPSVLELALTHSSYAHESKQETMCNERLEFLGDSVLSVVVAERLYLDYPGVDEGELTRMRANLVCERALAYQSAKIGLGDYLRLGKGEELSGGAHRPSITADAFEALIAALFIDGGMQEAKRFILKTVMDDPESETEKTDYKTYLQEVIQKSPEERLRYELVDATGPDHDRTFTVNLMLNSNVIGSGSGHSKKAAEQQAAYEALRLMGLK